MRARNIKPGLVENSTLGTGDIHIQFLFGMLPMLADKAGRLKDDPLWIKAKIFPYRDSPDVNGYLTVLSREGFITRYEVGGKRYIQITNFVEHQRPHHTEKDSDIPPLNNNTVGSPLSHRENPPDSLIHGFTDSHDSSKPCVSEFQKVFEAGEKLFPSLATKSTAIIHKWIEDGCIPETDIIPEIIRAAGKAIQSWTYFTAGIMNAKATRENPLPAGTPGKSKSGQVVFKSSAPVALPDDERAKNIRWNLKRNGYAISTQDEQWLHAYEASNQPEAQHA